MTTAIEQTLETYGIENWGAGYFDVNRKGNLIVHPAENDSRAADFPASFHTLLAQKREVMAGAEAAVRSIIADVALRDQRKQLALFHI